MSLGINPRVWSAIVLLVLSSAVFCCPALGEESGIAGKWITKVQGPRGGDVTITMEVELVDDKWTCKFTSPRGTRAMRKVVVTDNTLTFELPPQEGVTLKVSGKAVYDPADDSVDLTQSVTGYPDQKMKYTRFKDLANVGGKKRYARGSGPAGTWVGKIRMIDDEPIPVTLQLDKTEGEWMAVLSDPTMGPVEGENLQVTETRVTFTFRPETAPFPSSFSGSYIAAKDRITGTVSIRGHSRFIKFKREEGSFFIPSATLGGEPSEPLPIRHRYRMALTGRLSYWSALHVVQDETYNINNLTSSKLNFDGSFRYYLLDGFNVFVRGFRAGQGFDQSDSKLAEFAGIGLNKDSYLRTDGFEFGVMGYLGNVMMRDSKFNPYLTAAIGTVSWDLTSGGRGTTVLALDDVHFEGNDLSMAFGIGTEYKLSRSMALEFEWLWRYIATEDTKKWPDTNQWSNTHAWALSVGLTWGFGFPE